MAQSVEIPSATLAAAAVESGPIVADHELGLMLRPLRSGVLLERWCAEHFVLLDELVHRHGAVLLRDFGLDSAAAFERTAAAAIGGLFGDYGDLPRDAAGARIYRSTPYPPELMILFHNESSHLARWPMRIAFHCDRPAASGGCTPVVGTRALMRALEPELVEEFCRRGLAYARNFIPGVEPTWEQFFRTDDRNEVERACRADGSEIVWRADGGLRVRRPASGVARHPVSGEDVFFNQVQLHHVACLDPETRDALRALVDDDVDLPRTVTYGDDVAIPDDAVRHLVTVCEANALRFTWQAGDVLLLDNMLAAHARDPYAGERRILVAMGRLTSARDS